MKTNTLRSKAVFHVAQFRDNIAASHAAQDYAAQFTAGLPTYQPSRLYVKFDPDESGYYIAPNEFDFVASKNPAWLALVEEEKRTHASIAEKPAGIKARALKTVLI